MRSEPFPEEGLSQDEHPEATLMVLLPSTFPVLNENPYPEVEPHEETGGYSGVRERDDNPALREIATSHETLPKPRPVTSFAPVSQICMVRGGKSRTREARDLQRDMSDVIDFAVPSREERAEKSRERDERADRRARERFNAEESSGARI